MATRVTLRAWSLPDFIGERSLICQFSDDIPLPLGTIAEVITLDVMDNVPMLELDQRRDFSLEPFFVKPRFANDFNSNIDFSNGVTSFVDCSKIAGSQLPLKMILADRLHVFSCERPRSPMSTRGATDASER